MIEHDLILLFKGLCAGFFYTFISIPSMILTAHYLTAKGAFFGLMSALGTVLVQILWCIVAALISMGLMKFGNIDESSLGLTGAVIMFFMALKIYRSQEKQSQKEALTSNPMKAMGAGALLALAVPMRILGFVAIFAATHATPHSIPGGFSLVGGVVLGSALFWLIFSLAILGSKRMITPAALNKLQRSSALILVLFSLIGILQLYL